MTSGEAPATGPEEGAVECIIATMVKDAWYYFSMVGWQGGQLCPFVFLNNGGVVSVSRSCEGGGGGHWWVTKPSVLGSRRRRVVGRQVPLFLEQGSWMGGRGNEDLSESDYRRIVVGKRVPLLKREMEGCKGTPLLTRMDISLRCRPVTWVWLTRNKTKTKEKRTYLVRSPFARRAVSPRPVVFHL
jgi:hypothetical protein